MLGIPIKIAATAAGLSLAASYVIASGGGAQPQDLVPISWKCSSPGKVPAPKSETGVPDRQHRINPSDAQPVTVAAGKAKVVVGPGAVSSPVDVGVTALGKIDLAKLDPGLTNVTGADPGGFRFTPHPMKFTRAVEVTLPYDPALVPEGYKPTDVYTYFFDDKAGCWQSLDRVSVDEKAHTVTSKTDHFTDMINATAAVPEHPENVSFNPNQLKGIQVAEPGAKINQIAPPGASSGGDNNLAYPIEVPGGRGGLQPSVSVGYSSSGGNGWMGVGWDLSTPAIQVDSRWGVPRFSAAKETEGYVLNGAQLTPVAHRGPPVARSTGNKTFHTRIEGGFAKITRKNTTPKTYTWEVTDKSGTVSTYGGDGAELKDGAGNVAMWALREVKDLHGNFVRYHYTKVDDNGVGCAAACEDGWNLYLDKITYTGMYTGTTSKEGPYSVVFIRDRQIPGESLRNDKTIDARGGFKRVTADRLRKVEVRYCSAYDAAGACTNNELVRRYDFAYTLGAFDKTLLKKITQTDSDGNEFNKHEFSYFDDVRDTDGNYTLFKPKAWTVPGDSLGLGKLNIADENPGYASMLGANQSVTAGGHLYVGAAGTPLKGDSVGLKSGFSGTSNSGVLALTDVDGDNLPDKVFRDGGVVKYRKNLAKPGGELAFSGTAQTLDLGDADNQFFSERSESKTFGPEKYAGSAAFQLDYVNTFATTDKYFMDVNSDGIADLVNGTNVLFGRIVDNVPVYGISADKTPAPITQGQVDTSKLFPDFGTDATRLEKSTPLLDTVRRWVAPYTGFVRIQGDVKLAASTAAARAKSKTADGVKVSIQKKSTVLWSETIGATDNTAKTPSSVVSVPVNRGDAIYFRVQSLADGNLDEVSWDPKIDYPGKIATKDVNGLEAYTYQASSDFTLGGRTSQLPLPLTGTLKLTGELNKKSATTDDVTLVITKDNAEVFSQTITGTNTGTIPVDASIAVTAGQVLKWRIKTDSPIDLNAVEWTAEKAPRAYYTAATGVDKVVDANGKPYIDLAPVANIDMYPVDGLTAPQAPSFYCDDAWDNCSATITPKLLMAFGGEKPSGQMVFTAKYWNAVTSRFELVCKRVYTISGGVMTPPAACAKIDRHAGHIYFDYSTTNPILKSFVTSAGASVDQGGWTNTASAGVHTSAAEGAFAQPYRGWGVIGYVAGGARANSAIVESDLLIDDTYDDGLPDDVDPQGEKGAFGDDPKINPPAKSVPFFVSPETNRWQASSTSWAAASGMSSSRMGSASLGLPKASDFSGAVAVPRISRSQTISATGSASFPPGGSAGAGLGVGQSDALVDFMDMNGDGFPDVVGSKGIQYTDPTGGLGTDTGSWPADSAGARRGSTKSGNAKAGSAARTIQTGAGTADTTARHSAKTAQSGGDMPPLGVGDNFSGSKSEPDWDLMDVNGDGLPDRIKNGKVALNLGYRFGNAETWTDLGVINDGSSFSKGLDLGFNTDFYGFAGGASFEQSTSKTTETFADVNGDGLADKVFPGESNGSFRVALNTGAGFASNKITLGGAGNMVALDRNASLGGGAYAEHPLCFLGGCIIFNPGANGSVGVNRTETALRDINGDGLVDHLFSTDDNDLTVLENKTARTNMLKQVKRPLGAEINFDYTRDGNTYDMPSSHWVLSKVSVNDGHSGDGEDEQLTTFEYSDGKYDRKERAFRGYGQVVTHQHDTAASNDPVYRSNTAQFRTDSAYTAGLPTKSFTTDASGHKYSETENTYTTRDVGNPAATPDLSSDTATLFTFARRTDSKWFEGQASAGKSTYTTVDYDSLGNPTEQVDAGESGTADDVTTTTSYSDCSSTNVTLPTRTVVKVNGDVKRERTTTLDCGTGEVRQTNAKLDSETTATSDMTYYDNGNLKTLEGPKNKANQRFKNTYTYDSAVETYNASVTDSYGLTSSSTYDPKFGVMLTSTDTNNKTITNTYDKVARLKTVTGPYEAGTGKVTIAIDYHPEATTPYVKASHIDKQADGTYRTDTIDTITFIDGLGRAIQVKKDAAVHVGQGTSAADKMIVSGKVEYDGLGRAFKTYYPITEDKGASNTVFNPGKEDTVSPTVVEFDVTDRATRTTLPDGTFSTVSYGFGNDRDGVSQFETIATDANTNSTRTYTDVQGRTTAVKQFHKHDDDGAGPNPPVTDTIWTSYAYNALGEKTSVKDSDGNKTTMDYDNFGRNTFVDSPDSGRTDFYYDPASDLIKKHTAKLAANQFIEYDYDYNRIKATRYPVFTGNNVSYTYGAAGAANNAAGRVTKICDGAGVGDCANKPSQEFKYGLLGEVVEQTRRVKGTGNQEFTFVTSHEFDSWNRVLNMTYPDGEKLSYTYNSGGEVTAANGRKGSINYTYLSRLDYDKFGQRVYQVTGNGVRTSYTYNSEDRRLENLKSRLKDSVANGHTFQDIDYTYDNVGNVSQIQDKAAAPTSSQVGQQVGGPTTETFGYDDLNRLTTATGVYKPTANRTDQYGLNISYNNLSNITRKDQTRTINGSPDGALTYDNTYTYPATGKPHAVKTIAPAGQNAYTFAYDAAGNQTKRARQQEPTRQLIWDEENRLACTRDDQGGGDLDQAPSSCDNAGGTSSSRFLYDAGGERIVKQIDTYYFYPNQNYSTRGNEKYKHIYIGDTKLLTKSVEDNANQTETNQFYSHGDHIGSTGFVTDTNGQLAEHLKYIAGGETWVQDSSQPVAHQYTGKEYDQQTGLYYYGARYYDPRTSQWQSTDPALPGAADDSVGMSTYLYARGNPVTYTDPDGRQVPNGLFDGFDAISEFLFGGRSHSGINSPSGQGATRQAPQGGVGGVTGGFVRAATLRIVPMEDDATDNSQAGMQIGAMFTGVADTVMRLVTGEDVVHAPTSRVMAAIELGFAVAGAGGDAESFVARTAAHDGKTGFVLIKGGTWRAATAEEIANFKFGEKIEGGVEMSVSSFSNKGPITRTGSKTSVPMHIDEASTSTWHSHVKSKVAVTSEGDVEAFTKPFTPSGCQHCVTGTRKATAKFLEGQGLVPNQHLPSHAKFVTYVTDTACIRATLSEPDIFVNGVPLLK